jgi:hypothetical protein
MFNALGTSQKKKWPTYGKFDGFLRNFMKSHSDVSTHVVLYVGIFDRFPTNSAGLTASDGLEDGRIDN